MSIVSQQHEYHYNQKTFSAYIAHPENLDQSRFTILICHAWAGRDKFVEDIADKLAGLGYTAVALDVYGKNILGHTVEEKMGLMQPLLDDRQLLHNILTAGIKSLAELDNINHTQFIAMGYCFGGLCVLDLARTSEYLNKKYSIEISKVISIHGLFNKPSSINNINFDSNDYKITSKVLVLNGYLDPMVSSDDVISIMQELDNAKCLWQMNTFGMAKHAFTYPEADNNDLGTVYNQLAEERAWNDIKEFIRE